MEQSSSCCSGPNPTHGSTQPMDNSATSRRSQIVVRRRRRGGERGEEEEGSGRGRGTRRMSRVRERKKKNAAMHLNVSKSASDASIWTNELAWRQRMTSYRCPAETVDDPAWVFDPKKNPRTAPPSVRGISESASDAGLFTTSVATTPSRRRRDDDDLRVYVANPASAQSSTETLAAASM